MSNGSMERWAGILKVTLNPNTAGPFFKIAASLLQSPSSKTLAIPSLNAIFFKGDRVAGTGNPAIERLSDSKNIAEILVSKLGPSVNVWVVEASTFYGPFAVFKEFVPTVDLRGDPKRYDPAGFPFNGCAPALSLLPTCGPMPCAVLYNLFFTAIKLSLSSISSNTLAADKSKLLNKYEVPQSTTMTLSPTHNHATLCLSFSPFCKINNISLPSNSSQNR